MARRLYIFVHQQKKALIVWSILVVHGQHFVQSTKMRKVVFCTLVTIRGYWLLPLTPSPSYLYFWGHLHFWGRLYFEVVFIFEVIFIFEVVFTLRSSSESTRWVDQICFSQHQNPSWNTWDKYFECDTAQPSSKIWVWHGLADLLDCWVQCPD